MCVLKAENVCKQFDNLFALKNINLQVQKGEAIAIIGSSGSGKSTLLRCLNNLEKVSSGKISINNNVLVDTKNNVAQYPSRKEIRRICTQMGMVFQHFNLFPHLNCIENIMLAPVESFGKDKNKARNDALELLELVGLTSKEKVYPASLSGGQKQRVAIARALAMKPEIIFFDEPTSALDPETTTEVVNTIKKLIQNKTTMIIVTHDMRFARECASRVIFMDEGEILEENITSEVFDNSQNPRLKEFLKSIY